MHCAGFVILKSVYHQSKKISNSKNNDEDKDDDMTDVMVVKYLWKPVKREEDDNSYDDGDDEDDGCDDEMPADVFMVFDLYDVFVFVFFEMPDVLMVEYLWNPMNKSDIEEDVESTLLIGTMNYLMFSWSSICGNQRGAGGLSGDKGGSSSRADAKGNTWKKNISF